MRGHDDDATRPPNDTACRTAMRGIGQTLITLGVVVLLFIVYQAFITDIFTARTQDQLSQQLHDRWSSQDPTVGTPTQDTTYSDVPIGDALAVLRIPAFGPDYAQVVVQGTTASALEKGPGHYVDTAGPGEVGNFAVAGHRVGKGSPFLNVDKLVPGDAIVVETQTSWYVYRVIGDKASGDFRDPAYGAITGRTVTTPSDYQAIAPVPGDSAAAPVLRLLTLTTCHPKFSAAQRMIIHAHLDGEPLTKAQYPSAADVPALKEG
ncbi:class E sortase [Cumulibacter manganitolerans]|uniref:class E sortase n=1 Tax=Cumulibacter manganitolerans TaxID=1884992 RepID=UPI001297BC7A|nr:class E sortase [Cumulibacter manganitolerans]